HPSTFNHLWEFKINRLQIISMCIIAVLILFSLNYLLFAYTPVGNLLPETVTNKDKEQIVAAFLRAKHLEDDIDLQAKFTQNCQPAILVNCPIDAVKDVDSVQLKPNTVTLSSDTSESKVEELLGRNIQKRVNNMKDSHPTDVSLKSLYLFDPVE